MLVKSEYRFMYFTQQFQKVETFMEDITSDHQVLLRSVYFFLTLKDIT